MAKFFARLTGQETPSEAVITEVSDPPAMPVGLTLPPPPAITEEDLGDFDADDPAKVEAMVRKLAGIGTDNHRTVGTSGLRWLFLTCSCIGCDSRDPKRRSSMS